MLTILYLKVSLVFIGDSATCIMLCSCECIYVLFIFICICTLVNSQHYNIHSTGVRATPRMRCIEGIKLDVSVGGRGRILMRAGNVYTSYLNVGHCNSFISHERSGTRYCDCDFIL